MLDIHEYIADGAVKRVRIAMDIKFRKIGTDDLSEIVDAPEIKAAFFGQGYNKKVSKDQWTEVYLDKLSCAVAAECFNPEYLYYLNEVAEYVNREKEKSRSIIGKLQKLFRKISRWYQNHKVLVWFVLAVAAIALIIALRNK